MSSEQPQPNAVSKPSFGDIPLDCIRASSTNPRKIFDESHLQDLANSIKTQGVAQPILVRPVEVIEGITYFEIVAGERRFRASRIAGMLTVPAIVRELSDRQAYEIQVLENLQRVDLHPLEEAEGFEVMMATYGDTADELATKIGKSRAYIYASLKLCALIPEARAAFYSGSLTKSTALLVARIPVTAMQMTCVTEITTGYQGILSTRRAAQHIEQEYMLQLKKADFKPSDPDLCPAAGSCTACPKRTGNQPEIFVDVNADVCTDPICFKAKTTAHFIRLKQVATSKGQIVLSGAEARKIMPQSYSSLAGYVKLDDKNYDDEERRTYRQIIGKNKSLVALLENPHSEGFIEVVSVTDITPILDGLGIRTSKKTTADEEASKARERELAAKGKLEQAFRQQLFEANHHASLMMNLIDPDLRLVAYQLFSRLGSNTIPQTTMMRLHGWVKDSYDSFSRSKLQDAVDAFSPDQLNQFIRDCVLCGELETYSYTTNDPPKNLLAFAVRAKVDAKGIRATLTAAAKAKADAKQKSIDSKKAKVAKALASTEPEYVAPVPADPVAKKAPRSAIKPVTKDAAPVVAQVELASPINVDDATQASLSAFITKYPHRLAELTEVVLKHPRVDLIGMLERAAKEAGYVYARGGFEKLPRLLAGVDVAPGAANICPPLSTTVIDEGDAAAADGEFLAEMMAERSPPKKKAKAGTKTPRLAPESAWPFPKNSTGAREPADTITTETTQEITA